jgi:hypothetical protein
MTLSFVVEFITEWKEIENRKVSTPHHCFERITLLRILQTVLYPTLFHDRQFMSSIVDLIAYGSDEYAHFQNIIHC